MSELTDADRADAAVQLRVPMSGIPELDAMIREARRLDMATAAMQGLVVGRSAYPNEWAKAALDQSDALLAACEPKKAEPHPNSEGWIERLGGALNLNESDRIEVKLRDGTTLYGRAMAFDWSVDDCDGDIIAYRVVKEAEA